MRRARGHPPLDRGVHRWAEKNVSVLRVVCLPARVARGAKAQGRNAGVWALCISSPTVDGDCMHMYHPISQTQTVNMLLACGPLPMLGPGAPFTFIAHIMRCLWITAASEQAACRAAGWRVKSAISHCRAAVVSRPSTGPPVGHQAPVCGRQDLVKVIVC